ncbi:hypothetical protein [Pseudoduganella aquatica]|uniref:hypothetical protein n=1 Tax=Pseudoduganella aquatica TaxID=2660641 RepID=UPI001E525A13|nr:hypothetical protein [Pseudoduganella aquatica]
MGDDGKWEGMWDRYARGLVVPSGKRIGRIEMMVPGAAKYFYAGFWQLLENRAYSWEELDRTIDTLPPWVFPSLRRTAKFGRIGGSGKSAQFLQEAVEMISDPNNGIYGMAVILILIREAELVQDERQYVMALKSWAQANENRMCHPIISYISDPAFTRVASPLQEVTFSSNNSNECWVRFLKTYLQRYYAGKNPSPLDFDGLHCISLFFDFVPLEQEVLDRLVKYDRHERARYISYIKHLGIIEGNAGLDL